MTDAEWRGEETHESGRVRRAQSRLYLSATDTFMRIDPAYISYTPRASEHLTVPPVHCTLQRSRHPLQTPSSNMAQAIRSPVLEKDAPPAYADQPDLSCCEFLYSLSLPLLYSSLDCRVLQSIRPWCLVLTCAVPETVRPTLAACDSAGRSMSETPTDPRSLQSSPLSVISWSRSGRGRVLWVSTNIDLVSARRLTLLSLPAGNGRIKFDIIDDDPNTRLTKSLTIGFDNNRCTVTFGGLGCWMGKYVSVGRRRKGAISITVRLEHMARDGAYHWIWIPLEKRFELPQGQFVPSTFPFHLEGSMLPLFGPLGKLVGMINPGKHLITSESITSSERSSNVTFAKWYPQKCF